MDADDLQDGQSAGLDDAHRRAAKRESRREATLNYVFTALFFAAMLALVVVGYWLARSTALRPQVQPFQISYISTEAWEAKSQIEFPDSGVPPSVRRIPAGERVLPRLLIEDREDHVAFVSGNQPKTMDVKFYIPQRTVPGVYQGDFVVSDPRGQVSQQRLPVRVEVLDAMTGFRAGILWFALVTILVMLILLWAKPEPRLDVEMLNVGLDVQEPSSKIFPVSLEPARRGWLLVIGVVGIIGTLGWLFSRGHFDPASTLGFRILVAAFVAGAILFAWTRLYTRGLVPLKDLHEEMPEGELECSRSLFSLCVTVRFWASREGVLRALEDWPRSTLDLKHAGSAPSPYSVPARNDFQNRIFAHVLDASSDGRLIQKAFCFRFVRSRIDDAEVDTRQEKS